MIERLRKARRRVRSGRELRLLLSMALFMVSIPRLMSRPLPRSLELIDRRRRRLRSRSLGLEERVPLYLGALGRLNRWSLRDNCVVSSLTRYVFLGEPERPFELLFGVRVEGDALAGLGRRHVWLERDGVPVHETEDVRGYRVVYRHRGGHRDRDAG